MTERLFRGDAERYRSNRSVFDPITEGKRFGLPPTIALAIWHHVRLEATSPDGVCDEHRARERFAQVAERIAERAGHLGPAPFKWTQVDAASGAIPVGNVLADPVPGRTTLVLARASRARGEFGQVPGRATLVEGQAHSDVCTPEDSRGFVRRYVSGGRAARSKLERAIALRDRAAALVAMNALEQDLKAAWHHLANGLAHDEGLRGELVALDLAAEHLLAKVPNISRAVEGPAAASDGSREVPESAERRRAIGAPIEAPEIATAIEAPPVPSTEPTEAPGRAHADVARRSATDPVRLPTPMLDRMARALGQRFDDVELHPESAEVPTGQRAFTRQRHIYLEPGAVNLKSLQGEHIIAHELAHVVQQGSSGDRDGTRPELEREAARAATRTVQGQTTRIALRAQPTIAYAFSESAEHDDEQSAATSDGTDATDKDATRQLPNTHRMVADDHGANGPASDSEAAHGDRDSGASQAGTEAVSATLPAEETPMGAPAGSSAGPPRRQKEPPNVAAAKPEHGLGQLHGVRLDKLGPVLGEVHTAASADIARTRAAQHANPPKQMSSGVALAANATSSAAKPTKGAAPKEPAPHEAPPVATAAATAKDAAERPIKGEVPGGEATKQATQGAAVEQQKNAAEIITGVAHTIASWFSSWFGRGDDTSAGKMSDEESRQMAGSVDKIPTTTDSVSTDAGPPPELAMRSEAQTSADRDRAAFENKAAALETQGRADSRSPMGEDHIETTAPPEELTAMSLVAGMPAATPAATLPTLASAPSEEVGIVAQEQHGAEVDTALAKASADVAAERATHAEQEAKARAESDAQLHDLKATADADQATARASAQAEVQTARAQWQAEIDKKGADARKQAGRKVAEGMAQVEAEETKANAEARQHIEEGRRKADEEKQKGAKEAADAKEKAKHKSSGFWGWVSSKAKAAFDGVKKAVSSAIDACRRAVKAVIAGAKKLAMAAIELARKAINVAIKAIGQALIAISNVLLAAFPELKARFQNAIRKTVDKATAIVNKLADSLKQAVQKALDQLGAALDQALQLLEKGINAIVDVVGAVVQGAIKAAQAVVEMLGTWAKLIKDVATGPGSWISKLGAAIVDGIKNHLWSAFKTAVVDWFKSKVFELLGIGGVILQLLLDGGLTKEHIIEMALDALMVAIPAALIAILVEKLLSMIVPAAGALMAIIEGLQAAWGTISRIIAAFSAFMAFLIAVKSGGAGALFAAVLASAAVVVLDFVANWLLKKVASGARKVGAKLKGLAEKFKSKRKPKHDSKAPPSHHDEHDAKSAKDKHDDQDGHGEQKSKADQKKEEIERRVEKAQRELPPKITSLIAKKPSLLRVRAQFALWKLSYRLSRLELVGGPAERRIEAQVNPPVPLGPAGKVWELDWAVIAQVFDAVASNYVGHAMYPTAGSDIDYKTRTSGTEASLRQQGRYISGTHDDGNPATFEVQEKDKGFPGYLHGKVLEVRQTGAPTGRMYPAIAKDLQTRNVDPQALGRYLQAKFRGDAKLPPLPGGSQAVANELFGLWSFEAGHPRDRVAPPGGGAADYVPQFGQRRDYAYAMMTADLLATGHMSVEDAIMKHPAQGHGAQAGARAVTQADVKGTAQVPTDEKGRRAYDARKQREIDLIRRWLIAKTSGPNAKLWDTPPSRPTLENFVKAQISEFRALHGGE